MVPNMEQERTPMDFRRMLPWLIIVAAGIGLAVVAAVELGRTATFIMVVAILLVMLNRGLSVERKLARAVESLTAERRLKELLFETRGLVDQASRALGELSDRLVRLEIQIQLDGQKSVNDGLAARLDDVCHEVNSVQPSSTLQARPVMAVDVWRPEVSSECVLAAVHSLAEEIRDQRRGDMSQEEADLNVGLLRALAGLSKLIESGNTRGAYARVCQMGMAFRSN